MPANVLLGEVACLGAAGLWAVTVALFRRPIEEHGARAVNLAKCGIASVLLGATALATGAASLPPGGIGAGLAWIALSGIVGLTIGDSALFAAVTRLGVHRTLLLQTLAPAFAAMLDFAWRGERLAPSRLVGMAVTLAGVALVESARGEEHARATWRAGFALAVVAAAGQGFGIVIAKEGMSEVPVLSASFVRLATAAAGLALVGVFDGGAAAAWQLLRTRATLWRVVPASVLGSYVAILLMMTGVALAPAPVAAVLLATTPIFSLFFEAAMGRSTLRARDATGTLLAVAGVALL